MRKSRLVIITLIALILTGFVLGRAGWFSKSATRAGQKRHPLRIAASSSSELFATQAGWRYRRGESAHWKYMLLKR